MIDAPNPHTGAPPRGTDAAVKRGLGFAIPVNTVRTVVDRLVGSG